MKHLDPKTRIMAPLFDRLTDHEPDNPSGEKDPFRSYTRKDFEASIQREVSLILNTRERRIIRHSNEHDDPYAEDLPGYFGLPDFASFDTTSELGRDHIALEVEKTIERYEPRLKDVEVHVLGYDRKKQSLSLTVGASLVAFPEDPKFVFPVNIEHLDEQLSLSA